MAIKRFRRITKWQKFVPGDTPLDKFIIFLLAIPIISTIVVLGYLLCGRSEVYYEEIK